MNSMREFGAWLLEQTNDWIFGLRSPYRNIPPCPKISGLRLAVAFQKDLSCMAFLLTVTTNGASKPIVLECGTPAS